MDLFHHRYERLVIIDIIRTCDYNRQRLRTPSKIYESLDSLKLCSTLLCLAMLSMPLSYYRKGSFSFLLSIEVLSPRVYLCLFGDPIYKCFSKDIFSLWFVGTSQNNTSNFIRQILGRKKKIDNSDIISCSPRAGKPPAGLTQASVA